MSSTPNLQPRKLTQQEIEDILSSIPPVKSADKQVSISARESMLGVLNEQLSRISIVPLGIPHLKNEILKQYNSSQITPGTTVGVSAAEALGAPITQMALNTFHAAGSSKNVSAGVGRIRELINITPNPKHPSCSVYFTDRSTTFERVLTEMRPEFAETRVSDFVSDMDTDDPDALMPEGEPWWYQVFRQGVRNDFVTDQFVMRLFLNTKTMYAYKITMEQLATAIENSDGVICVYSPIRVGIIDIYPIPAVVNNNISTGSVVNASNASLIFLRTVVAPKLDEIQIKGIRGIRGMFPVVLPVLSIVRNEINDGTGRNIWFLQYNHNRMQVSGISSLELIRLVRVAGMEIVELPEQYLSDFLGIQGLGEESPMARIRRMVVEDEKADREWEISEKRSGNLFPTRPPSELARVSKFVYADTQGSNLKLLLGRDDVDPNHTVSNNVHEILAALGIEASRNFLYLEFLKVIANEGSYINPRHIGVLVDFMTNPGRLVSITYSGIQRQPTGALAKASFERAMDIFKEAGAFGKQEPISSTSTSIYVGKKALIGTGYMDVLMSEDAAEEQQRNIQQQRKVDPTDFKNAIANMDDLAFGGDFIESDNRDMEAMFTQPMLQSASERQGATTVSRGPVTPSRISQPQVVRTQPEPIESRSMPVVSQNLLEVAEQIQEAPCIQPTTVRNDDIDGDGGSYGGTGGDGSAMVDDQSMAGMQPQPIGRALPQVTQPITRTLRPLGTSPQRSQGLPIATGGAPRTLAPRAISAATGGRQLPTGLMQQMQTASQTELPSTTSSGRIGSGTRSIAPRRRN